MAQAVWLLTPPRPMIPGCTLKTTRRPQPHLLPLCLRARRAQPIHVLHIRRIHQHHRHPRGHHLLIDEPPIARPEIPERPPILVAEPHIGLNANRGAHRRQPLQRLHGLPPIRPLRQLGRINQEQPHPLITLAHNRVAVGHPLHHTVRGSAHRRVAARRTSRPRLARLRRLC